MPSMGQRLYFTSTRLVTDIIENTNGKYLNGNSKQKICMENIEVLK